MSMLRKAAKAIGTANARGSARAIPRSKAFTKAFKQAMRPKRTLGSKIKGAFKNVGRMVVPGLAAYGALDLGKKAVKMGAKTAGKDKSKKDGFKNNRERWASEESYVPQSQRKAMGGPVYNRGRKIPGMRYD